MTGEQIKKIRGYYHSLKYHEKMLSDLPKEIPYVSGPTSEIINAEIYQIEAHFPDLVPNMNLASIGDNINGLKTIIGYILGRIEPELADSQDATVTQKKEFSFIKDFKLKNIIERDYQEIQRAFISQCWKSVLILAGGLIEAVLLDGLQVKGSLVNTAQKAPQNKSDLLKWDLSNGHL